MLILLVRKETAVSRKLKCCASQYTLFVYQLYQIPRDEPD